MKLNDKIKLELDFTSALELLQILDNSTAGYSIEFAPDRIVRLRAILEQLDTKLDKIVL